MIIRAYPAGLLATNTYLVVDETTRQALIIDAPNDCAPELLAAINEEKATVTAILLTHSHWDHTSGAHELKSALGVPVLVHELDEYRMLRPGEELIQPPFPLAPMKADGYLKDGMPVSIGATEFRVIHTPGHTEGSVCFYSRSEKLLMSGDTLFAGSVGRTDLPGGSWETLMQSLQSLLMPLPEDVRVFPGHGPETIMGEELQFNPFLNGQYAG